MTHKKVMKGKNESVEELYQNTNFVPPESKCFETIFEEPRISKEGSTLLTSVKKYRRYLHFDFDAVNKIKKRKNKIFKKCKAEVNSRKRRTRCCPKQKKVEVTDISSYISEIMGDSSDSDVDMPELLKETKKVKSNIDEVKTTNDLEKDNISSHTASSSGISPSNAPSISYVGRHLQTSNVSEVADSKNVYSEDKTELQTSMNVEKGVAEESPSKYSCVVN